ncbi:hypothetical protein B0H16DRAFT_1720166 [Mycena metata]|uniref:Uncharacterized protein n=1 Tax=Mycena metata TaxID=1033252 RepID=A0AAD7JB08_9AGAR|nr:hypothetical protein B0H16DRAFT_1720166 [Mycena metata]
MISPTSAFGFCVSSLNPHWFRQLLRKAIDSWVLEREEFRPLYLKSSDWEMLEALDKTLKVLLFTIIPHNFDLTGRQVFTQVTLQMSRSRTPTLPWVLPMYEWMRKHLKQCMVDATLPASLRDATGAAFEKLETY